MNNLEVVRLEKGRIHTFNMLDPENKEHKIKELSLTLNCLKEIKLCSNCPNFEKLIIGTVNSYFRIELADRTGPASSGFHPRSSLPTSLLQPNPDGPAATQLHPQSPLRRRPDLQHPHHKIFFTAPPSRRPELSHV